MSFKTLAIAFAETAVLAFVVGAAGSLLYNLIAHGTGHSDWEFSVRIAIILGIALPLARVFEKKPSTRLAAIR